MNVARLSATQIEKNKETKSNENSNDIVNFVVKILWQAVENPWNDMRL